MLRRPRLLTLLLALGSSALLAGRVDAITVDFDALPPLTDVADVAFPGLRIATNLAVDEAAAADLTGFDTAAWATSGQAGLFNALAPEIRFVFGTAITSFTVDVLGLPAGGGVFQGVLAEAWRGETLVDLAFSDVDRVGDSGFHEDVLRLSGDGIDRVTLSPASPAPCSNGGFCFELGPSSSVFIDTLRFEPVPEPGSALLLLAGLSGLAASRRR